MKIIDWIKLPETREIGNIDSSSVTELHRAIIQKKKFLKRLYADWYGEFKKVEAYVPEGLLVELGSGGGFLKTLMPGIITSDILFLKGIDLNFSVTDMPLKDNTVASFFMLDVLHHIKNPYKFLNELERCLKVGGKIVMIEPANTLWGRFVWKNFHHEKFDSSGTWDSEGTGPMSSANSALPWIIFFRDRERFKKDFPALKINRVQFHTPIRYLISGGCSTRQLLPSCAYDLIKGIELVLSPFNKYIGMFLTIEIERKV